MQMERLPQLVIAQTLMGEIEGVMEIKDRERRLLLDRFTSELRPLCKLIEEAFERGFDAGADWQAHQKGNK